MQITLLKFDTKCYNFLLVLYLKKETRGEIGEFIQYSLKRTCIKSKGANSFRPTRTRLVMKSEKTFGVIRVKRQLQSAAFPRRRETTCCSRNLACEFTEDNNNRRDRWKMEGKGSANDVF